jgi:hypothetical protein
VLGSLSAFLGRQRAIGVHLLLESLEERFTRGARAGSAVVRASPLDFCRDAPVDVLGHVASPPFVVALRSRGLPIIASASHDAPSASFGVYGPTPAIHSRR